MGLRSSKTAPEHFQVEEDRHSAWGSDIDETFCGTGTICADEWTPMNSLAPSPESQRRRISDLRIEDDDVITEQPRLFENSDRNSDRMTDYDVMTIHEFQEDFVGPPLVPPVIPKKKKMRKKRKMKKRLKKKIPEETFVLNNYKNPQKIRHLRKHRPRHHVIHVRRIRIHQDPRYPKIPPPNNNSNLKFRRGVSDNRGDHRLRYSKAVPPRHLKGMSISTKPHFRYRGIPKIIM